MNSLLMNKPRGCSYDLPFGRLMVVEREEDIAFEGQISPNKDLEICCTTNWQVPDSDWI